MLESMGGENAPQPTKSEAEYISKERAKNNGRPSTNKKPKKDDNEALKLEDFWADGPGGDFLHRPTGKKWSAKSLKAHFNGSAHKTVSKARSFQTRTWIPGRPQIMVDTIAKKAYIQQRRGYNAYNSYEPPAIGEGDPQEAKPWLEHIEMVYPDNANHIIQWLAHRIQRPHEKINHAIVLGGKQGIGKDTLLAPAVHAIGPWNFQEVSPNQLLGRFNGFVRSVILRVSEARDMGDSDRYALYEHLKQYTAAPPEFLRCDEKYTQEYPVKNVCGVIITTNHKQGGIYLPSDDRRHYVAWSDKDKTDFTEKYWNDLWNWYENGGFQNVYSLLTGWDLSDFNPKAPPEKTDAFWEFVDAGRSEQDSELAHALEKMNNPTAVTMDQIKTEAEWSLKDWLNDRRNRSKIPHKMANIGYEKIVRKDVNDTRFSTSCGRKLVYGNLNYSKRERIDAANKL